MSHQNKAEIFPTWLKTIIINQEKLGPGQLKERSSSKNVDAVEKLTSECISA